MFYTKLVIQAPDKTIFSETFDAILTKRWDFVSITTSGGTKAYRFTADSDWTLNKNINDYNSADSKAKIDSWFSTAPPNTEYYEGIRVWDSADVAQAFVTAIQTLNLSGVTISYEGGTDPTAV